MATVFPIGQSFQVNSGNNQNTLILSSPDYNEMGGFSVHFTNGADSGGTPFVGSLQVVARGGSKQASDDSSAFVPHPHRPAFLNGNVLAAGSIYSLTYALITGTTLTLIPGSGMSIALVVTCASGVGKLYITPIVGESAIG